MLALVGEVSFPDKSCCIIVLPSSGYLWVITSNDAKNPVKISMSPKYSYSKGIKILCHGPISHCFIFKNQKVSITYN